MRMILQIIISNGILDLVTGILAKISLGTGIWFPPFTTLYDQIAKENISKISIKHVFSTIFSTVLELLQTVYREKTKLQLVVFIDEKLSRADGSQERDHCSVLSSTKISSWPGLKNLLEPR